VASYQLIFRGLLCAPAPSLRRCVEKIGVFLEEVPQANTPIFSTQRRREGAGAQRRPRKKYFSLDRLSREEYPTTF